MQSRPRILIIDDDEDILDLLKYNFVKEGFEVKTLNETSKAMYVTSQFNPSLVILDLIMGPYNGIEICKMIRDNSDGDNPYIFFLTANATDYHQHAVFNVGGDEFVEKIAGIKTLITKVKCVLNQKFVIKKRELKLKVGKLEMYRSIGEVHYFGERVRVKDQEFDVLFFLAQNPEKNISISQLTNTLWGSKTFMDENSVKMLVHSLRGKIGEHIISERGQNVFRFVSKHLFK